MRYFQFITFFLFLTSPVGAVDIRNSIVEYYQKIPHEKIFVHTDKNQYVAGDTVWFRAHLVDAMTLMNKSESRFVYIELYDNNKKMLERHMVKRDSVGVFSNALRLSPQLPTGAYTLMAYTQWMQNFPNKRFFYKRITIADKDATSMTQDDDEAIYVSDAPSGMADSDIKVSQRNEYLTVQYIPNQKTNDKNLSLAIYGSGNIVVVDSLTDKPVSFMQKELCLGTVNIAVVNSDTGDVLAERLAFIKGAGLPDVSVSITPEEDKNMLDIEVKNVDGRSIMGDFSISITDADIVKKDTTQQDIATSLLVGSELTPFDTNIPQLCNIKTMSDIIRLDNIMSRQKEMRFSLDEMLNGNAKQMKYDIQRDQRISGIIQGTLRKKIKTPHILLLNPAMGTLDRYDLPSNTHFNLTDMDFQEGISFMLEATRHNGSNGLVELKLDEQTFPTPYAVSTIANNRILTNDFLKYERMQAAINGLYDMNYLEEIEIKGYHKPTDDNKEFFEPRRSYDKARDGVTIYKDMVTWLRSMGYTIYTDREIGPVLYIDGFRSNIQDLHSIDPSTVKRINYYLGRNGEVNYYLKNDFDGGVTSSIINAFDEGKGFIYIELELPKPHAKDNPLAIKTLRPLGYMPPKNLGSFSRPKENDRVDMRTTLFWSPYVKLSTDGKASIRFYPSDTSKRYRITIQGISDNGQIISKEIEL